MDLTEGSVFKKFIIFSIPVLLTNLLQQLYHSADVIVVGNFARDSQNALAAVGASGSVTSLLLNLFLGLSLGANVVCANFYGSRDGEKLRRAMETSLLLAAASGVFVGAVGFVFAEPILTAVGVPESVLPNAVIYMKIVFLGQPGSLVYNFGAGILRSHGDTKRPMYILFASGLVNVILNVIFVAVFHLDSAGVALATSVSHYCSAAAVLYLLCSSKGEQSLSLRRLRMDWSLLGSISRIGIPGGINGMIFSISNVIISRAVFRMGEAVVAGDSAATSLTNLVFTVLSAFYTASVSFSGQNYGAKKFKRIDRLLWQSILLSMGCLIVISVVMNSFSDFFVGLFTTEQAVVEIGATRLLVVSYSYVVYCVSEMCIGCLRGMGKSVLPTALNAVMICVPRIIWVLFVVPHFTHLGLGFIYLCYAISYVFSGVAQFACYLYYMGKEKKKYAKMLSEEKALSA